MKFIRLSAWRAIAGFAFASLLAPLAPISASAQTVGLLEQLLGPLSPTTVGENAGMASFKVVLNAAATSDVNVNWRTLSDTAVIGEDFKTASGTLAFAMGETEKTFTVEIVNDNLDEDDEEFVIEFSSPAITTQTITHKVTITDDNDAPPFLDFAPASFPTNVQENDGMVNFTVGIRGGAGRAVTVDYATADGTAVVDEDYKTSTGTLTFAKGDTEKTFTVEIVDDALDEDDENFSIKFTSPDNTARDTDRTVTITGDNDDAPEISMEIAGEDKDDDGAVVVREDGGTVTFTAVLSKAAGRNTIVQYAVTAGNTTPFVTGTPDDGNLADVGEDLADKRELLFFDKGESRKTFVVNITDDALDENDEYFGIAFFGMPVEHLMTKTEFVKITGDNDDPPVLTIDRSVVHENQETWDFTARLDRPSGRLALFTIRTTDRTAEKGKDYRDTTRAIDIPKGATERRFRIQPLIMADALDEEDETFLFSMSSQAGTLQVSDHELTIIDDDGPPAVTLAPASVQEGDGQVTFTATLASSGRDVTVDYATEDRTAVAGEDYVPNEGTLSFAKGETEATFTVNVTDDALAEIDETFAIAFESPDGTALKSAHEVTINMDNDSAPTAEFEIASSGVNEAGKVTVAATLSAPSGVDATLTYRTADGTATTAGSDYTAVSGGTLIIPAGETRGTFDITTLTDTSAEGDETFKVELTAAVGATLGTRKEHTVTIHDDDGTLPSVTLTPTAVAEHIGTATFTATLNGGTSGTDYSVAYATVDGTAVAGEDYASNSGTLNFTSTETNPTISIDITDDSADEIIGETFSIALTSSDGSVQESVHVVEIQDGDAAPTLTISPGEVNEDDGTVVFIASLSEASGRTATVEYATSDGSASAMDDAMTMLANEMDYQAASGTLTFAKGDTVERFAVDIIDDSLDENDETFNIAFTSSDSTVQESMLAVTITGDNDHPPYLNTGGLEIVQEDPPSHVPNETLVLLSDATGRDVVPSGRDVTFHYVTRDHVTPNLAHATAGEDYVAASGTLTIPKGQTSKSIALDITDDDLVEDEEVFILSLTSPDGTAIGLNETVLILEDPDDVALPTVSLDKTTVAEADGTVTLTATLGGTVDGNVTVEWATADDTAMAGQDYTAGSGTLNFTSADKTDTFDIVVTQDMLDEEDETFDISFTSMDGTAQAATVEMTITDDDDTPTAAFVFPTNDDNVMENVATGQDFTVKLVDGTGADLTGGSSKDIVINYEIVDGTATRGVDYSGEKTGTITIPKGMPSATVSSAFSFIDDDVYEGNETFKVKFTNMDGNVTLPTPSEVTVTITDNESVPTVQFETASSSVSEGGTVAVSTILSNPASVGLTIEYSTAAGTAEDASDYTGISSGYTIPAGVTRSSFIVIATLSDDDDESDETFMINLHPNPQFSGPVTVGAQGTHTVTILDDDGTEPTVSLSPSSVSESAGTATFAATLSETVTSDMTIDYRTASGTALAGEDFTSKTGTLEFTAASPNPTITIDITNDALDEAEETFLILLSSATNAIQASANEVAIEDDDAPPTISLSRTRVAEDGGNASFVAVLSKANARDYIQFRYATSDGTAAAFQDYRPVNNTIGMFPGQTRSRAFTVDILDDMRREGDETFNISLAEDEESTFYTPVGEIVASTHAVTIDDDEDDVLPTVSVTPGSVDEDAGTATFKASLDGDFLGTVTVEYATSDGTAEAGEDYVSITGGSLTFTAAAPNPTFTVRITDDALDEGDETFDIDFSSANGTAAVSSHTVTITGDNDDPPSVMLDNDIVQEEGGMVTFTATLSEASGQDVTIDYVTSSDGETAAPYADYVPLFTGDGELTIAKGQTTGTFEIEIANDALEEGDETFRIELDSSDGTIQPYAHVVTIDDDESLPVVMLAPTEVNENAGTATFTASLREAAAGDVNVEWETENGTGAAGAVAGEDYVTNSGSFTISGSSPNPTFTIEITEDSLDEADETFGVKITSSDGTAKETTHAVTIIDNDAAPAVSIDVASVEENAGAVTFTATLASASGRAAKVAFATADDTAEAGEDYEANSGVLTFAKGETSKTFAIVITDDALDENDESFDIALTSPDGTVQPLTRSVTIGNDNDEPPNARIDTFFTMENEGTEMFNLVLSSASGREAKVTYETSDVNALAGEDYRATSGTVTFAKGETTKQFPVVIINDALHEVTESFNITLSSPDSTVEVCYQCADRFTTYVHAVGILDDDDPPAVTLTPTNVGEDDGTVTFTAELASSGQEVTVEYATADGTAMAGDDYTTASGTLTFPEGETTQTFEVTLVDDAVSERDETFDIALTSSDMTAQEMTHTIKVFDDDFAPVVVGSFLDDTPKRENIGAFNLFLQLFDSMSQPVNDGVNREIVVNYELVDGTAAHGEDFVGPKTGTVTISKLNQFQVFRSVFLIVDDGVHEADETFKIKLTIASGNATVEKAEYVVTIMDDDDPPSLSLTPLRVPEADATVTFTATLGEASGRASTIEYSTSGVTATEGTDYDAASGTLNIAKGDRSATFDIAIKNDSTTENDETFSVAFMSMNGSASASTHTVTIDDDEDDTLPRVVFDKSSVDEDDGTVTFTASLSKTITSDVTVNYATSNGTAEAGEDYVLADGPLTFTSANPTQTLTITITDDALDENDETFGIVITSSDSTAEGSTHTVTIAGDNDDPPAISISPTSVGEDGGDAVNTEVTFTATLSEASGREAKTTFWTINGTAIAGTPAEGADAHFGSASRTLIFAKGETEKTFKLKILDNTELDGDKSFQIAFASSDGTIQDSTRDITIVDNERPPLPTVSLTPASVNENQGTVTFTASLDRTVTENVTVEWTTDDGTAVQGEDYVTNSGTLNFTTSTPSPTLTVEILDDALDEGDETFDIDFTSNDGTAIASTHTVTITGDNDDAPSVSIARTAVMESDGTVTFTARLSEASGRQAQTTYMTTGGTATEGTDYEAATGTLTYEKGETEKSFTVTITEDAMDEVNETFDIVLTSADNTVQSLTHTIILADNDDPPQISVSPLSVPESAGHQTFTLTLSAASGRAVSVEFFTSQTGAAVPNQDYRSASAPVTFATGEMSKTVSVEILEDTLDEDAETFDIGFFSQDGTAENSTHTVTITDNDAAPSVSLEIAGGTKDSDGAVVVNEDDGTVTFTAVMSKPSGRSTVAAYTIVAGNTTPAQITNIPSNGDAADVGEDLVEMNGTLTFNEGDTRKTFDIEILDDALDENDEYFVIAFTGANNAAHVAAASSLNLVKITGDNDDAPTVTLSPTRVGEQDGNVTFTATLSPASGREAMVDYATSGITATQDTDYAQANGGLTFAKGDTEETFTIRITDDSDQEGNETFQVEFRSPDSTVAASTHIVTISDDELPSVTLSPASVNENAGTATFTASLSGTAAGDVTVEWTTDDGTAVAGQDYVSKSGTLSFTTSTPNPTLTVDIIDDSLDEEDETFDIEITSNDGTAADSTHAVTITGDNDGPPAITLSPTQVGEGDGTVTFTATLASSGREATVEYVTTGGTATEGTDYAAANGSLTFAKGDMEETFTIDITDDSSQEGIETFQVAFTSSDSTAQPSMHEVTIIDDEIPSVTLAPATVSENIGTATFTASLSGTATGDVTVEWRTENGTGDAGAVAGEDYSTRSGTLNITSSNPNPTIAIPIANDRLDEVAETFGIRITSANNTAQASTHTVTITDDDEPPAVSISPTRVNETDGTATFTARLDSSGRVTTVEYETSDGTASAGQDYVRTTGTLTFAKDDVEESFTVDITDDALDEGDETFDIELSSSNGTARNSTHAVTITGDNDDPPSVSLSPSVVDEDAGRVTFTATLSEASGRTATVAYETSNGTARAGTDYDRAAGTLTFAAGDTSETFEIAMRDNSQEDGDKTFRVGLRSPNGTAEASTHTVTIEDDDSLPRVRLTPARVGEGDGAVTFTASLAGRVSGDVAVEWSTSNGTAEAGEDYATANGTLTFTTASPNPTLSITMVDDNLNEIEETFEIRFESANGTARASSHEVTIADDDSLPVIGLTVDRTSVDEGGRVVATATLTPASGRQVGVDAVVEDGTTTGRDYAVSGLTGGRLAFAKGDTTETYEIDIVDDSLNELAETFTVRLRDPEAATLGAQVSHTVTISADGSDPEPSVSFATAATSVQEGDELAVEAELSAESGRQVTVEFATADATGVNAAVAGEDYQAATGTLTFSPGETRARSARGSGVQVEADGIEEESEIFDISMSSPVGASLGQPSGMRVTILDGDDPILQPVVNYLAAQAEALLSQQPRLSGILRGESSQDSTPGFSLSASDDGTNARGGFSAGTVWGSATGVWSSRDDAERRHLLGTIGAHAEVSDDLMLGGMLQFDTVAGDLEGGTGEIRGTGWMAGPYIAVRDPSGRLNIEGRLLYGRSSNEIEGFSTSTGQLRDGSFDGERWLAHTRVEAEYRLRNGAIILPSADLGHVRQVTDGFRDSLGRDVEGQTATLTQLELGTTFVIPVELARGDLMFRPGLRFVATDEDGGQYGESRLEAAGRIDFGIDYRLEGNLSLEFDSFYSGLGQRDRESYGAGVGLRMDF